jgi:hypothetical protein
VRIASDDEIGSAIAGFAEAVPPLTGYRDEMLNHSTAGRSLRNYALLTANPERIAGLGLSEDELFWSRYYWLARFAREWQALAGYDAGVEQQVFHLLIKGQFDYEPLPEVEAAVERDAVLRLV